MRQTCSYPGLYKQTPIDEPGKCLRPSPKFGYSEFKGQNVDKGPHTTELLEQRIAELESELQLYSEQENEPIEPIYDPEDALLERFLASNSIAIIRANVRGELLEVNDAFTDLLGYSKEEMLSGQVRWDAITPPEFRSRDEDAIRQIHETGSALPYEKEYVRKDGQRVSVYIAVRAIDKTGDDCFCFVLNVTDQRRTEAELQKSEAQFRLLSEAMPHMVFALRPDGKTEYFNKRWSELVGVESAEGFEQRWTEIMHPDDVDPIIKAWETAVANTGAFECEGRYRHKDGHFYWHLIRALPMFNTTGEVVKWFGTLTDIDVQKKAEEELRASELRFRTLADAIPQIVWTAYPNGQIDFFNHRWFEYTGLSVEQSLNDGWKLLIHPDDLASYLAEWERALSTGDTYEKDFRLKRAVGIKASPANSYRRHLGRAVALRGKNGQVIKWFATWTEINK